MPKNVNLPDFLISGRQNSDDGEQSAMSFVVRRSHIQFVLYDTLASTSFPIAISSRASTKLFGYLGSPTISADWLARSAGMITIFFRRILYGEVVKVEAVYSPPNGQASPDGKMLLIFVSRAANPRPEIIQQLLTRYGPELHKFWLEDSKDWFFLTLSRILYSCQ